jgi:hypothetical protein
MKELTQQEFNAMPVEKRILCTKCGARLKPMMIRPSQIMLCPTCYENTSQYEQGLLTAKLLTEYRNRKYDLSQVPKETVSKLARDMI